MINYVYQGNKITLNWTVKKGAGLALEDFSRAATHLFLIHGRYRFVVPCTVGPYPTDGSEVTVPTGTVYAEITESLPEGTYSAEILWVKNFDSFNGSRNLQRTRVDNLFCVTVNESEASSDQAPAVITATTVAHAYGYDGLSAYEAAVFRGYTGTEEEYYDSILKYEVVVTADPDFPDDGIWRFVKATESSDSYTMYFGDKVVTGSIIPSAELDELHDLYTNGVDASMLSSELQSEVAKLPTIGVIDMEDLDDVGTLANRLSNAPARYVVTQTISNDTYKVGVLDVFSEGPGRVVTEVLTTHNILSDGELLINTTDDKQVFQYFRSCKLKNSSTLDVNVGEWTDWQELLPSVIDAYATKVYVEDKSRVVSQSASVTFYGSSYPIGGESYYTTGSVLIPVKKGQIVEVEGTETIKYAVLNGTSSVYASGYGKVSYTPTSNINVTIGNTSSTSAPAVVTIYDTLASLQARIAALES